MAGQGALAAACFLRPSPPLRCSSPSERRLNIEYRIECRPRTFVGSTFSRASMYVLHTVHTVCTQSPCRSSSRVTDDVSAAMWQLAAMGYLPKYVALRHADGASPVAEGGAIALLLYRRVALLHRPTPEQDRERQNLPALLAGLPTYLSSLRLAYQGYRELINYYGQIRT